MAFKLPAGWVPPLYVFTDIYQLNYYGLNSAPLEIMPNWEGEVSFLVNTGYCTMATGCENFSGLDTVSGYKPRGIAGGPYYAIPKGTVVPNVWYEVLVHAHWTTTNNGVVEVWSRTRGSFAWTKTVDLHGGFPTLQWGLSGNEGINITPDMLPGKPSVDKFGIYRGPASFPTSIWHDTFCRATSFDAAASCFH